MKAIVTAALIMGFAIAVLPVRSADISNSTGAPPAPPCASAGMIAASGAPPWWKSPALSDASRQVPATGNPDGLKSDSALSPIIVPIQIVRVADDNGSRQARITAAEAQAWIDYANSVYAAASIQFTFDPLSSFATVRSTLVNNMTGTGDATWNSARRTMNQIAASFPGKMVVVARWGSGSSPTGGGFSWWDYDFVVLPGYYDTAHCTGQNYKLMAHEIGHHLGLPHTFGGSFNTVADAEADFAARGNDPSAYEGDGFSDTPPHPSIYPQECPPSPSQITLNDVLFDLPRSNIMSYYYEAATVTPQQTARARWLASYYLNNGAHLPANQGVQGVLEAETLPVIQSQNASYGSQSMAGFGADGWSGNAHLFVGFSSGGSITLQISVGTAGQYAVELYSTLAPDFGIAQCSLDGTPIGNSVDAYAPVVLPSGRILLGTTNLSAGNHSFRIANIGKNSLSSGYLFGIDCLRLVNTAANSLPTIQRPPLSQTVGAGDHLTLTVGVNGTAPLSFQWHKNGTPIGGSTNATHQINPAATNDSGVYFVTVTNVAGTASSSNAVVTVTPGLLSPLKLEGESTGVDQVAGGAYYFAQNMSGFGPGWSGNTQLFLGLNLGSAVTLGIPVQNPGWYQVSLFATQAPDFGIAQCRMDGIPIGPPIDAYASTVRPSGRIALGVVYLGFGLHRLEFMAIGKNSLSSNYRFGIDYLELADYFPPGLLTQPDDRIVYAGTNVSWAVTANGTGPLAYQWLFNNLPVAGATNEFLTLVGVQRANAGAYRVTVSNQAGVTLGSNATLRVLVRQRFEDLQWLTNGGIQFAFKDEDGGLPVPSNNVTFVVQATSNLTEAVWSTLPQPAVLTNGRFVWTDPEATNFGRRFYRIIEP